MIFVIVLLVYLLIYQAICIGQDCNQISVLSKGGYRSLDDAPNSGEILTWSYPLFVVEPEAQRVSEESKGVGRWQGYCITVENNGLAISRLCHHVYNINETGISGFFTGSNLDAGEDEISVAITGGVGGQINAGGSLNITYMAGIGTYYHDTILCFD